MKSMTIISILAGFQVTGVYPQDHSKFIKIGEDLWTPKNSIFQSYVEYQAPKSSDSKFLSKQLSEFYHKSDDADEASDEYAKWKKMYRLQLDVIVDSANAVPALSLILFQLFFTLPYWVWILCENGNSACPSSQKHINLSISSFSNTCGSRE
jgi:hypothetical protein